ncbi:hypothetical protein AN1V17_35910 [Vallitalea sediminicola]
MIKNSTNLYKDYIESLIKESQLCLKNNLACPVLLDNFMADARINLLNKEEYSNLASMYELIGNHYKSMNNLFFNNYITINYYAISLLNISCYYYKYAENEYYRLLLQSIIYSHQSVLNEFTDINSRFVNEYALNVELMGDLYLLLDKDKAIEYYKKAKLLYAKVDIYDQLSDSNCFWYSYACIERTIALKKCFNLEVDLSDVGIERIQQKMEL